MSGVEEPETRNLLTAAVIAWLKEMDTVLVQGKRHNYMENPIANAIRGAGGVAVMVKGADLFIEGQQRMLPVYARLWLENFDQGAYPEYDEGSNRRP